MTLGAMFQTEALVVGVRSSLDFFVGAYADIAVWQSAAVRLLALRRLTTVPSISLQEDHPS